MSTWAVLVVHGVGDTRPGATVDSLVSTLAQARPCLEPDGQIEVHDLPDDFGAGPPQPDVPLFPMHVRRASVLPGMPPLAAGPDRAVFAEVYWSDLSRVREGTLHQLLSLFSTIFSLRFVADQAALMPRQPTTWRANNARELARWLRWLLHCSAWMLCGPVAALTALLAWILAIDVLILRRSSPRTDLAMLIACLVAAVVGAITWGWALRNRWGSSSTRFWSSFGIAGASTAALAAWLMFDPDNRYWSNFQEWVRVALELRKELVLTGTVGHAAILLLAMQFAFLILMITLLVAMVFWFVAWVVAPPRWRAGLTVAYGAGLLQLSLWLLVVPLAAMAAVRVFLPESATTQINALLHNVQDNSVLHLGFALSLAAVFGCVALARWRWVGKYSPPHAYPDPRPAIPRLLVNHWVLRGLMVLVLLGALISTDRYAHRIWPNLPVAGFVSGWLEGLVPDPIVDEIARLLVSVAVLLSSLLTRWLRSALHIVVDVTNHFYRRFDPVPLPGRRTGSNPVQDFEIQQHIEKRFRSVLFWLLRDPDVTHLTVVSHSQGTVIAVDVFCLVGLDAATRTALRDRLAPLAEFHLITMGSPLTHLYQHYFPNRYPSLTDPAWDDLKQTLRHWVNVYRIDDYVGTYIESPVAGWTSAPPRQAVPIPHNVPIAAGGHIHYWGCPAVFSLPEVHDALPG